MKAEKPVAQKQKQKSSFKYGYSDFGIASIE